MGRRDGTQRAIRDIMARSKQVKSREDVTAMMVGKLAHITEIDHDGRAIREIGMEIADDRDRAYGCMMGLVSLVVQYSERSGGLVALCNYLTAQLEDRDNAGLDLMETRW